MRAHATAVVSAKAQIADDVVIGPFSVVTDGVTIGAGCSIGAHCLIDGNTVLGERCQIFTGAVVGSRPQDLKFKNERSFLEIGEGTIIREYCTLNPGTGEGGKTVVGTQNLFMAYSHVAHDCRVGNNCVFANNATLAGHVTVEDRAVIGGLVAVHQFVRVGMLSIIGGCSKVVQDIPPFSTCDGHPARIFGLNLIGLRRNSVSKESIRQLDQAFRILFNAGHTITVALAELERAGLSGPQVDYLKQFVRSSERGISRSCSRKSSAA